MTNKVSNTAARKAGSAVRAFAQGRITEEELAPHLENIFNYRASFSEPLKSVHESLAETHRRIGVQGTITHRLKSKVTILDKLLRLEGTDLSRMQDIGGCRSVVRTLDELERVKQAILDSRSAKVYDYVTAPRDSGYRAIHLIVKQEARLIEIQLRTLSMHLWAETVEAFSSTLGDNFKQDGDSELQLFLKALAEFSAVADTGVSPTREAFDNVDRLRPVVQALLERAGIGAVKEKLL